jgi:hypothetical protein
VKGTLAYRPFIDENGHKKSEASIIGEFIQHISNEGGQAPTAGELAELVEIARN